MRVKYNAIQTAQGDVREIAPTMTWFCGVYLLSVLGKVRKSPLVLLEFASPRFMYFAIQNAKKGEVMFLYPWELAKYLTSISRPVKLARHFNTTA